MIALERPSRGTYPAWMKRALDLALAIPASLVLLLPGIVLALLVKISSPGPALFRQQRIGQGGELFWLYKFRSMRTGGGPAVTARGDSRITPLGSWMRKWKLDELPQLINVLRSDMSLVGPRPEVPEFVAFYTDEQRNVLEVVPGMTGLSQLEFRSEEQLLAGQPDVRAYYLTEVMPRKLEIDLRYVRTRSLLLDLHVILRTFAAVLKRGE